MNFADIQNEQPTPQNQRRPRTSGVGAPAMAPPVIGVIFRPPEHPPQQNHQQPKQPPGCAATTKAGKPCKFPVDPLHIYCRIHRAHPPGGVGALPIRKPQPDQQNMAGPDDLPPGRRIRYWQDKAETAEPGSDEQIYAQLQELAATRQLRRKPQPEQQNQQQWSPPGDCPWLTTPANCEWPVCNLDAAGCRHTAKAAELRRRLNDAIFAPPAPLPQPEQQQQQQPPVQAGAELAPPRMHQMLGNAPSAAGPPEMPAAPAVGFADGIAYATDMIRYHRSRDGNNDIVKLLNAEADRALYRAASNSDYGVDVAATAERIARTISNAIDLAIDPDELASLCAAVGTEAQRIATVELRRIADSAYALGVRRATPAPTPSDAPAVIDAAAERIAESGRPMPVTRFDALKAVAASELNMANYSGWQDGYQAGYATGIKHSSPAPRWTGDDYEGGTAVLVADLDSITLTDDETDRALAAEMSLCYVDPEVPQHCPTPNTCAAFICQKELPDGRPESVISTTTKPDDAYRMGYANGLAYGRREQQPDVQPCRAPAPCCGSCLRPDDEQQQPPPAPAPGGADADTMSSIAQNLHIIAESADVQQHIANRQAAAMERQAAAMEIIATKGIRTYD